MSDAPDLRTQLAAYLAGDLDDAASADIEARIASEPWVAREADALADMAMALGRVDEVDPPEGFEARLVARLAEEVGHELPPPRAGLDAGVAHGAGAAAFDGWSRRPPRRLDGRRPEAARRRRTAWLATAAAVAVLFLGSTAVLRSGFSSDDSADSADSAAAGGGEVNGRMATSEALMDEGVREGAVEEGAAEEAAMAADAPAEEDLAEEAPADAEDAAITADEAGVAADVAQETEETAGPAAAAEATPADGGDAGGSASSGAADVPRPTEGGGTTGAPPDDAAADGPQGDAAGTQPGPEGSAPDGGAELAPPSQPGPATIEREGLAGDQARLREEVAGHPAAQQLLGRSADEGAGLAGPYTDELLRAEDFSEGTPPGECVQDVLAEAPDGAVPAVAALLVDGEQVRLAYALVRSTDGAVLDQVDVWVVDPEECAVLAVVS